MLLGVEHVDAQTATETANILLKYRSDIEKAIKEFAQSEETFAAVGTSGDQAGDQEA